jgi:hypothetical protein
MKIARVEYTVTVTGEDGKTVAVNKERILTELDLTGPEHIHQILEQELQATEEPATLNSIYKCNSNSWFRRSAAVASWLCLTDQSKRSTQERLHTADPRTTVSNSCPFASRAAADSKYSVT